MIPIPKYHPGDLFRNTKEELNDAGRTACVGSNGGPYDTGQLALGYFAAAHQLLLWDVPDQHIEELPIEGQSALTVSIDLKVYPIVYCYRHGTELALKHLLFKISTFFKAPTPEVLKKHIHSLDELWKPLSPYLNRLRAEAAAVYPNNSRRCRFLEQQLDPETLLNVGAILLEIDSIDKSSTTFRYAWDQLKNPPPGHMQYIILDKLFHFMLPVNIWFEEMICRADELKPSQVFCADEAKVQPNIEQMREVIALAEAAAREAAAGERALEVTDEHELFPEGWERLPEDAFRKLIEYIEGMPELEQAKLIALVWLGSSLGGATADLYAALVERARRKRHPAEYIAYKPLTRYLRNGLKKLGLSADEAVNKPLQQTGPA